MSNQFSIIKGCTIAALLGVPLAANATNGDQLLGVSAIHWGMAGAVVAAPQDAATIFTNPAGIGELNIETVRFDLSPGFLNPPREINGVESDSNLFFLPSGAVVFNAGDGLFVGLGLGAQSGMGVDVADSVPTTAGNQAVVTTKGLFKLAPSVAVKVNDRLTLGGSLNIGYQSLALQNPRLSFPQNQQFGFGVSLGAVYHVSNQVQFGASWSSKMDIREHEFNTSSGKFKVDLDAPAQLALGLAFKPMPGMLVEADVRWIRFSDTNDSVAIERPSGYVGTVPASLDFGWDNQMVLAVGVQKEMNPKTTVRMGVNYGKSPIGTEDVDNNVGSIAIPEWHLSLGMTRQMSDKISTSVSYTRAFENEITSSTGTGTKIKLSQNILYGQVSYAY